MAYNDYHDLYDVCQARSCYKILCTQNLSMMTSSNGNIFRVTGPLFGEFTGHRWIPRTKANDAELWCFLWSVPWIRGWVNNCEAGDLGRQRAHYDVIAMHTVNPVCLLLLMVTSKRNSVSHSVISKSVLCLIFLQEKYSITCVISVSRNNRE